MRPLKLLRGFLGAVAFAGVVGVGTSVSAGASTPQPAPILSAVRAAHHTGYDRVVFEFKGAIPTRHAVSYVNSVLADPSGKVVHVEGKYFLQLHMQPATAYNPAGSIVPVRTTPGLPNVVQVVRTGDFEAVLTYTIGLNQRVPVHVFTLSSPSRVVVDIPVLTWPTLKVGSHGTDVRAAQYMLRAHGYRIAADGVYGPATKAAVLSFQHGKGLVSDGIIGERTWPALLSTIGYGSVGDMVRALQVELGKNGASVEVDGVFGPLTRAATKHVQAEKWLASTGVVNPMTWMAFVCGAPA